LATSTSSPPSPPPDTLLNCSSFLKQQIESASAPAAAIIVRKSSISYPCVWKGKSKEAWPFKDSDDGVFMQLESQTNRAVFFTQLKERKGSRSVGETVPLEVDSFALFPPLFDAPK